MYNPEKHGDYETYIHTIVRPEIHRQNSRSKIFRKIGSSIASAAKNIAIGFGVAAVALGGVHVVGAHFLGFHVVRAAHVLYEVAFAFGAVGVGKWIYDNATSKGNLPQKVTEKDDKKALRKSMPELTRESSGEEDTSFTFKSFFVKIRRRFSSPDLTQTASADYSIKRFNGER
jgi:hypothetical protein